MKTLLYIETRNGEVLQTDPLGRFETDDEREAVLAAEIKLCTENGAASKLIEALEQWDMKTNLVYQYDTRTRRYGNWVIVS